MTHRALITQMLEALLEPAATFSKTYAAITAAREYLAAPEQSEPVGYFYLDDGQWKQAQDQISFPACTKLYAHPAPKAEPDDKDLTIAYMVGYHKGKTDAQPKAEPRKHCVQCGQELMSDFTDTCYACNQKHWSRAEQAPQPAELTDVEILALDCVSQNRLESVIEFARAVLAAQGAKT